MTFSVGIEVLDRCQRFNRDPDVHNGMLIGPDTQTMPMFGPSRPEDI